MMISPPSADDPYAAAAALDRQLRSPGGDAESASSDSVTLESGPDVVVTLSKGSSSPSTYNASGKLSGAPTLDDMGANAPDSMAHATESDAGAFTPDATSASSGASDANADVGQDAAVAA